MLISVQSRLFAVATALLSLSAVAATLAVPDYVEVQSINGAEVRAGLLQRQRQYEIAAGPVVLELRYNDVQSSELGDSHSNFRSAPVAIRFQAEGEQRYRIQASQPASERAAAAFNAAPFFSVVSEGGTTALPQQFFSAEDVKKAKLPLAQAPAVAPGTPASSGGGDGAGGQAQGDLAAQNLWFWWQQAGQTAREAFLRRIGR